VISYDTGVSRAVDPKEFARLANDPNAGTGGATYTPPAGMGGPAAQPQAGGRGGDVGRGAASPAPAGTSAGAPFGRR
jgi:twitching motility protein PilT